MVRAAPAPPATATHDPHDRVHERRWYTLAVLCLSLVLIVMDNTILNVAIPSLVRDLGASNSQLQWIIDSYTLVFAGLLLTAGAFGDRYGRKLALRIGLVLFALASVGSALASTPNQLIATRGLLGIGGALIMPSTLSIITNTFRDPRERGRAIAIWAGFSGLGVAIGPLVGGFLVEHFSWNAVFWVNLPIVAFALVAGHFFVPESRDPREPRLDLVGAGLSIVALGSLIFGIIEGPSKGWTDPLVVGSFFLGVVAGVAFLLWEWKAPNPMLELRFFRNPRFSVANGAVTLTFFAMFGSMFLMTQYWQFVHGYSPLEAGVRMLPYAGVMMVAAPMSARVVERLGTKIVVGGGLVIIAVSLFAVSFAEVDSSYWSVMGRMMLMALGMGFVMAPSTESVMGSLPREKAGVGSAVNDTTRQVGGALGVAVIGSVVASVYADRIVAAASSLGLAGPTLEAAKASLGGALAVAGEAGPGGAALVDAAREGFVDALSAGLRIGGVVVLVASAVVFAFLPSHAYTPAASPDELPSGDPGLGPEPAQSDGLAPEPAS